MFYYILKLINVERIWDSDILVVISTVESISASFIGSRAYCTPTRKCTHKPAYFCREEVMCDMRWTII